MPGCDICTTFSGTAEELWQQTHGTDAYGNLPQYKKDQHVGNKWNPCPYSTQSSIARTEFKLGTLPTRADHTAPDGKIHYMKPDRKNAWGYECTYDDCPHLISTGKRYFYR